MNNSWEKFEPSPIEFMHGFLMDEFHRWRRTITEDTIVPMDGMSFNKILVAAKNATYEKYKALGLDNPVLKSSLK